jgi:hypothetical protein
MQVMRTAGDQPVASGEILTATCRGAWSIIAIAAFSPIWETLTLWCLQYL